MYCNSCGKFVENGAVFCTGCGKKINEPVISSEQTVTAAPEPKPAETAVPVPEEKREVSLLDMMAPIKEEPIAPETNAAASQNSASVQPMNIGVYEKEPPVMPYVPEVKKSVPEKTYFGKGALAFCLVIIGLLAISTGVFAGLYFSLL